MYSIGQLSRISGMTAKALRLYHERGILVPTVVNPATGYRYYDDGALERARAIAALRSMLVSLEGYSDSPCRDSAGQRYDRDSGAAPRPNRREATKVVWGA